MKLFLPLIIVFFLMVNSTLAQEKPARDNFSHAVGFHCGMYSGWGNSYRFFPQKFGFQVNSMVFHQTLRSGTTFFSIGGSLMYSLARDSKFNLYAHLSSGYNYRKTRNYYDTNNGNAMENLSAGYGIGVDYSLGRFMMNAYYAMGFRRNFEVYSMWGFGAGLYYQF